MIRHYFHERPERLTLRRFVDLGGAGARYMHAAARGQRPQGEAPAKHESFGG
jgi:hypothetical protein